MRPVKGDELLTREEFKKFVFGRDNNECVICKEEAVDAHHIIERKLFNDGGYYLDNGVSVCEQHHLHAETTKVSCTELREAAGIRQAILPPCLTKDTDYDKWGNPILPNGQRLRGEMFYDEQVQKILPVDIQVLFTDKVKFPRTYHLPWSPNLQNDDRKLESLDGFKRERVVITEKRDGENTTMYRDYLHARALEFSPRKDRTWIRALHGRIKYDLPEGWRFCGENIYAEHSIHYTDLDSYFELFSVWNEKNICLNWQEVWTWADLLEIGLVPVLYKGMWEDVPWSWLEDKMDANSVEGYVVRVEREFPYKDYKHLVGKYVRKNHVRTDDHWTTKPVVPNDLKGY